MEPLIGITCGHETDPRDRFYANSGYIRSIEMAGGVPVLIPPLEGRERLAFLLRQVDGLLLPGGFDVDPVLFGEEPLPGLGRIDPVVDGLEISAAQIALERGLPVLGICRGIQVLNVAAGGTLYQDITTQKQGTLLQHQQNAPRWYATHEVSIEPDSIVERMLGGRSARVNSFHHQAIKAVAPAFRVTAKSRDGVIEAIEGKQHPFAVGVQWHPELMWERYPAIRGIFIEFVRSCSPQRQAAAGYGGR